MKNIIKLAYVVLCTLVVSCSSFLDEKPQSDFMQEGTGTEDQESKYGSLADAQYSSCRVRMRVLKQIYSSRKIILLEMCSPIIVISAEMVW
ncbi:hypothetical protein NXV81_03645 [Bacteroides ovatus]|nr:hypothetical protein [Bacteroides ovatus]